MVEKDEKYYQIIGGAQKLFMSKGIRNVSMDDIARALGVSKKTVYRYVENKKDLLKQILEYMMENIKARIAAVENMNLNAIDILLEMSKIVGDRLMKFNPVVSFELEKYFPAVYDEYKNVKKRLVKEFILKNIEQGIKEGYYRDDLNGEVVAHLYFERIQDVYNPEVVEQEGFSFEELFRVMFENHIRAISNEKGLEYLKKQKDKLIFKI